MKSKRKITNSNLSNLWDTKVVSTRSTCSKNKRQWKLQNATTEKKKKEKKTEMTIIDCN